MPYRVLMAILAASTWILANPSARAQGHDHDHHGHKHHGHDTRGIELGFSAGVVHLDEEDEDAPGIHLHVLKRIGDDGWRERVAVGLGSEFIFGDHEHISAMLTLSVYPWRGLLLSVAPGVEWADHEGEWEANYATHFELGYVFEVGDFDVGPVIDYSTTGDEDHYMIGLHFGIHL